MVKHIAVVVALWILFSVAALAVILNFAPFPVAASEEAVEVDYAFTVLTIFEVPVCPLCARLSRIRKSIREARQDP